MRIYVNKEKRCIIVETRVPSERPPGDHLHEEELTLTEAFVMKKSWDAAIEELSEEVVHG